MKGLIIKDLMCLRKMRAAFVFVTVASFVITVMAFMPYLKSKFDKVQSSVTTDFVSKEQMSQMIDEIMDSDTHLQNGESEIQEEKVEKPAKLSSTELLDKAIAGEIPVYGTSLDGEDYTFYITDLSFDEYDYCSYSIGDMVDLDNDGEKELIIDSIDAYGGMFLDARDEKVYVLAEGNGTAMWLGYTTYNGKTYICYSNTTHLGYETFYLDEYNGDGKVVDSIYLEADYPDSEYLDENATCYLNDTEISVAEYEALREEIFGY